MYTLARLNKCLSAVVTALLLLFAISGHRATAAEEMISKSGLTVYLGLIPAEIVKGPSPHSAELPMHGRIPRGPHEYHVVAAIFDAATVLEFFACGADVGAWHNPLLWS